MLSRGVANGRAAHYNELGTFTAADTDYYVTQNVLHLIKDNNLAFSAKIQIFINASCTSRERYFLICKHFCFFCSLKVKVSLNSV